MGAMALLSGIGAIAGFPVFAGSVGLIAGSVSLGVGGGLLLGSSSFLGYRIVKDNKAQTATRDNIEIADAPAVQSPAASGNSIAFSRSHVSRVGQCAWDNVL